MKVLVAGWFSFEKCNITAGDLMARDVACEWLEKSGYQYNVALAPPFSGGVDWRTVVPKDYTHLVFVCGPFNYSESSKQFLQRFDHCRLIGLDLSMIEPVDVWNPFDVLLERDSSVTTRPDISFASRQQKVPVVGVILVHPQVEYKNRARHEVANDAIYRLIDSRQAAAVPIDTCLDPNTTNLRNAEEVESLIAKMDLVVTTRLHGTVLALKNGVPVIAVDAIVGGAKVTKQAKNIGWDLVFSVENLNDLELQKAFDYCLSEQAVIKVKECRARAIESVDKIGQEFIEAMNGTYSDNGRIYVKEKLVDLDTTASSVSFEDWLKYPLRKVKPFLSPAANSLGKWLVEKTH